MTSSTLIGKDGRTLYLKNGTRVTHLKVSHVSIFQPSLAIGAELMIYMYIHEQKTSARK